MPKATRRFTPARSIGWLLNTLLILLALATALIGVRLPLAEQAVRDAARLQGLPEPAVRVARLHPDGILLTNVSVPELDWRADRIAIDLAPAWQPIRWLQRVTIDGVDATIDLTRDRPFGGLAAMGGGPPKTTADTEAGPVRLPSVSIHDATVRIVGRDRSATLRVDGRVDRRSGGHVQAAVRGAAETSAGTLEIGISASKLAGEPSLSVEVDGTVDLAALPRLPGLPARVAGGTAKLRFAADADVPPLGAIAGLDDLARGTGTATLSIDARDVELPPFAYRVSATATLRADLRRDAVVVGLGQPLRIAAGRVDRWALARLGLPGHVANLIGRARDLTLAPWSPGGELIELRRTNGRWALDGRGTLRAGFADGGGARIRASIEGRIAPDDGTMDVSVDPLRLTATDLNVAGQRIATASFDGTARMTEAAVESAGAVSAKLGELAAGGETLRDVSIEAPIRLSRTDDVVAIRVTDTARIRHPGDLAIGPMALGPVEVRIPSARLRQTPDGVRGRASLDPGTVTLRQDSGVMDGATVTPGPVRVTLDGARFGATLTDARAELPGVGLRARGIALNVQLGRTGQPVGTVEVGRIADTRSPARFAPVAVEAVLRKAANQLTAAGTVRLIDLGIATPFAGRHDLGTGEGMLRLSETEIGFAQGELQPRAISPRLALLSRVTGRVTLQSTLRWTPTRVDTPARVTLDKLDFETPTGRFENVNGSVRMTSLSPPVSAPEQTVRADQVVAGVPLTDVEARFAVVEADGSTAFQIDRARGRLADGEVSVRDTGYRLGAERNDVTVRIAGLSLAKLFDQLDIRGVSGEGQLSGAIPVAITTGGVAVNDGQLAAETAGVLRIKLDRAGAALEQQSRPVRLMVRAMENFQYDTLALTVNREPAGGLSMRVEMDGKNPDVLDGYPFAFNITLSGDVEPILLALQKGRKLTTDLLQRALEADKGRE
jgi:hypothetical protein